MVARRNVQLECRFIVAEQLALYLLHLAPCRAPILQTHRYVIPPTAIRGNDAEPTAIFRADDGQPPAIVVLATIIEEVQRLKILLVVLFRFFSGGTTVEGVNRANSSAHWFTQAFSRQTLPAHDLQQRIPWALESRAAR